MPPHTSQSHEPPISTILNQVLRKHHCTATNKWIASCCHLSYCNPLDSQNRQHSRQLVYYLKNKLETSVSYTCTDKHPILLGSWSILFNYACWLALITWSVCLPCSLFVPHFLVYTVMSNQLVMRPLFCYLAIFQYIYAITVPDCRQPDWRNGIEVKTKDMCVLQYLCWYICK